MSMTATSSSGGQVVTVTGEGDFRNDPNLGSMTVTASGGLRQITMQAVMDGTTMYMTSDGLRSELPGGKTWLAMDIAKVAKTLGVDMPSSWSSQSPADSLALLRASGSTVTKIGPETVDGLATTHYTAIVNPERAAKVMKALGESVSYQPVDVWVDEQGLVRRMHLAYSTSGSARLPSTTMDSTITLSDYGEPVNVTVPPSWTTFDVTKLAASFKP